MGASRRWLVCGGPMEFVTASSALLEGGGVSGIEWEPLPSRAYVRVASSIESGGLDVVVMGGVFSGDPVEVACTVSGIGAGLCVLCMAGAADVAGEVVAHGVTAAVEPYALSGLIGQLRRDDEEREPFGAFDDAWVGEPLPDEVLDEIATAFADTAPPTTATHVPIWPAGGTRVSYLPPAQTQIVLARSEPVPPAARVVPCVPADAPKVPTVCFASARGGVGKSALAAIAALCLAHEGLNVCVIDLDYQFGTCLGYLGADETDGLFDVDAPPSEPVSLDDRSLARCRAQVCPGVVGYEFCRAPEQAEMLASCSGALVEAARRGCDVAIVDCPSGVSEVTAQAFEMSDRCLLVGDHRALSLESLGLQQALCARIGVPRAKLVTVLNRCDPRHRDEGFLARAPFELHTAQIMKVADGGPEVMQMLAIGAAGELVSSRNRFALSCADLIRSVCTDLGCLQAAARPARPMLPAPRSKPQRGQAVPRSKRKQKRKEQACPS